MPKSRIFTDIVLVDVINFTRLPDEDQLVTAMTINDGVRDFLELLPVQCLLQAQEIVRSILPTGDGFYLILNEGLVGYGPLFALSLRNDLLSVSRKRGGLYEGIKVAVHSGTALPFKDATGRKNYVGRGLNECERLLQDSAIKEEAIRFAGDKNYVLISKDSWASFNHAFPLQEFGDFLRMLDFRYSEEHAFTDNHGEIHFARVLDMSRHVSVLPPRPSDALDRIKRTAGAARR